MFGEGFRCARKTFGSNVAVRDARERGSDLLTGVLNLVSERVSLNAGTNGQSERKSKDDECKILEQGL